jgi:hypothetical protein
LVNKPGPANVEIKGRPSRPEWISMTPAKPGNPIHRSIAAAQRRIFCQATLHALGWSALAGLAVGGTVFLTGRLCAAPSPWWVYAVIAGVAVAAAPLVAWSRRPGVDETAGLIDERLGLKDRLGTALYAESISNDPFARRVVEDAQAAAGGLRLGQAFRIRMTRVWGWVPVAAAVVLLLVVFTPALDLLGIGSRRSRRMAQQAVAAQSKEETAKAIQAVEKLKEHEPSLKDKQTEESMAQLAELTKRHLLDP